MNIKKLIFIFISLLLCQSCNCSVNKNISKRVEKSVHSKQELYKEVLIDFINNDTIDFNIVLMSCDTCAPITNIGYRVVVKLSEQQEKRIKEIDSAHWERLLLDEKTDWAANLVLYYINQKDAFLLKNYNDEVKWRKSLKQEDVKYWKVWLQQHGSVTEK